MKIKGNTKGSEFLTLKKYIEAKYGQKGVKELEKKMMKLVYPLNFDEIKASHWYPEALNVLAFIVAKEIFGWRDLFEIGYNSPVFSFGVKVFIKFLPLNFIQKEVPKIWSKFVDVGTLELFQPRKKEYILQLKDYKFHPEMCRYYEGFFLRMAEYLIKSKKITIKETKCMFKGDPYHEFFVKFK
jgi:hypothetical protein